MQTGFDAEAYNLEFKQNQRLYYALGQNDAHPMASLQTFENCIPRHGQNCDATDACATGTRGTAGLLHR